MPLDVRCRPGSSEKTEQAQGGLGVVRCRPGSSETEHDDAYGSGEVRCRPGSSETRGDDAVPQAAQCAAAQAA